MEPAQVEEAVGQAEEAVVEEALEQALAEEAVVEASVEAEEAPGRLLAPPTRLGRRGRSIAE